MNKTARRTNANGPQTMMIRQNNVILTHSQARVLWASLNGVLPHEDDQRTRLPEDIYRLTWSITDTFAEFVDRNGIMLIERGVNNG